MSYCSYSLCPRMKILTSMLKGNVPSSFLNLYKYLASLNTDHLSHTIKMRKMVKYKLIQPVHSNTMSQIMGPNMRQHRNDLVVSYSLLFGVQ